MENKKVLIFGAGGRVGTYLTNYLLSHNTDIVAVDYLPQSFLSKKMRRIHLDARIASPQSQAHLSNYGDTDVLNKALLVELLTKEKPNIIVNYAIPFTWDATKALPNYAKISQAGLGAFSPIQVLAPSTIASAIYSSGIEATLVVGNLPDITVPIIHGLAKHHGMALPVCGAGNVGLIEMAIKRQVAQEHDVNDRQVRVSLVAHHIHWVAPREPGYSNDAPFLLKIEIDGVDVTEECGDSRVLVNRAIVEQYEDGAGFSSTTGLLAGRLIKALLDESGQQYHLHLPAPNGLPGGYPCLVQNGKIQVQMPSEWSLQHAVDIMQKAQQSDGIDSIGDDGTIHFNQDSIDILQRELNMTLPKTVTPVELNKVAQQQISVAKSAISAET